ncbi:MAG: hypothetical protein P1U41_05825 [Vicingaceae bacterium]|nr:hypothetical protein [Vicingaceae bacterium]
MVKQFILLIQLIGVFFYQLVLTGDVTVSQKIPDTIQVGSESVVEIRVNKSDASGFAKVQQDLPAGFNVEPIETKGATFSFKENRIKFIWMSLPSEEEFTVSYKLVPLESTVGDFSIAGKFSFIADSERKNIQISPAKFTVLEQDVVAELPVEEPVAEEEPVVEEEPVLEEEPVIEEPESIEVVSTRNIEKLEEGKYTVTLAINKKGVEGFAKITEIIPSGFKASEIESNGGVFSFKEGVAKVLWMAIPKGEELNIKYNLESVTAENGNYDITGDFSFLDNEETKKIATEKSTVELNIEVVVDETPDPVEEEPLAVVEETPEEEPVVEEPVVEEEPVIDPPVADETPVVENDPTENDNNEETQVTSIPSPETNVSYKVQVGAGHQTVAANYFAKRFNLKDNVSTENHEGWIKYLVGAFNQYKDARDKRNVVRNNIKTAFVTAYNSGKRITVQEALMISNQKWYK